MAAQDRNNPTSLIWAFLIVAFIVISYIFPNFPRQVFRVAVGGIENIVMGLAGAVEEDIAAEESMESVDGAQAIESIYPEDVKTIFGACDRSLMTLYTPYEPMLVSKLNGITVMSETSMLGTRVDTLPQGTSIMVTGDGVCMNGIGWWPVEWIAAGETMTGWSMGGKMKVDSSVEFYFAKQ